jgi:hypothetical protein
MFKRDRKEYILQANAVYQIRNPIFIVYLNCLQIVL